MPVTAGGAGTAADPREHESGYTGLEPGYVRADFVDDADHIFSFIDEITTDQGLLWNSVLAIRETRGSGRSTQSVRSMARWVPAATSEST